jgi:hypothetical protein
MSTQLISLWCIKRNRLLRLGFRVRMRGTFALGFRAQLCARLRTENNFTDQHGKPSQGMGWQNHRGETVSTSHPDFAAQIFWTQGPLSQTHTLWCHPLGLGLLIHRMQALATQFFKALHPFLVFWFFTLAEMIRVVSKLGRAIGQCISAWQCLMVAQHAQIAFILCQPTYTKFSF